MKQPSLFGTTLPPHARFTAPLDGYAEKPGTRPVGQSCGTCAHCAFRQARSGRRFYKCDLIIGGWTRDTATDIRLSSPACRRHEPGVPRRTGVL